MYKRPRASIVTTSGWCFANKSASIGRAPASGKSTLTPSLSKGAVIMKMISSTSITSMYGTTLISAINLRRRSGAGIELLLHPDRSVALQNGRELFDEGIEPKFQPAHLVREAIVGNHGGNGRKQPHGRGDQGFGDARRHRRQRRLLHVAEIVKRTHDSPDRTEQSHIRTGRAHRRE